MNLILINLMINYDTSMSVNHIWQLLIVFLFTQLNICISCLLPGTSVTNWMATVDAIESGGQLRAQALLQIVGARGDCLGSNLQF